LPDRTPSPNADENSISSQSWNMLGSEGMRGNSRPSERLRRALEQFQEKCEAVFRPELRQNKELDRFCVFVKT
jgi:hypothetical protein